MSSLSWLFFFAISLVQRPALCVPQGKISSSLDNQDVAKLTHCQPGVIITGTAAFLPSAAPDLAAPAPSGGSGCGGCYLVADVAGECTASYDKDNATKLPTIGVVWYQEVFINTAATAVVSVGVGNGTSATRTSIYQNEGQLTVGNPSASAGSVALTQLNYQPTANIEGAQLYVLPL